MKSSTSIVLILLSIGLFYSFTNAQYQDVQSLNTLANNYQDVLQQVSDITQLRDNLLVQYEAFPKEEIDHINKVLPNNVDTVRLALDLDGMASKHGISIKNIQTTVSAPTNDPSLVVLPDYTNTYEKATITFTFVSRYKDFLLFLTDLQKSLRVMDVQTISFQSGDNGLYEFQVSVETYWLK